MVGGHTRRWPNWNSNPGDGGGEQLGCWRGARYINLTIIQNMNGSHIENEVAGFVIFSLTSKQDNE